MRAVLGSVWTYIALGVMGGLLVTFVYDYYPARLVLHLGDALIVAALIGGFLHVKEVSDLFESLARKTLIEDNYMHKLSAGQLKNLRSRALRLTVEQAVSNTSHMWQDLVETIDREIFDSCLPTLTDHLVGMYRSGYDEAIQISFMPLVEALKDSGAEIPDGNPVQDGPEIRKHTTVTTFELLCPSAGEFLDFSYPLSFSLTDVPGFPQDKRIRVSIGEDEDSAESVPLGATPPRLGTVTLSAEPVFHVKGSRKFWIKTEEWYLGSDARFLLGTMSFLTRGLYVNLSSDREFHFGGGIFGIGREPEPKIMARSISLRYDSWLLEDNGYIIWWELR